MPNYPSLPIFRSCPMTRSVIVNPSSACVASILVDLYIYFSIHRIKNFCGSIADSVTSKENILHIRYYAEPSAVQSKFEILYTAFRDKPAGLCTYPCCGCVCI